MEEVEGQVGFEDARSGEVVEVARCRHLVAEAQVQRFPHRRLQQLPHAVPIIRFYFVRKISI